MSTDIFADALACADAEAQAQFFNNFYRHLRVACKGREETQLCYIADHLDENGRAMFKELHEFAQISIETRAKTESTIAELYGRRRELEAEVAALVESKKELEAAS